METTWKPWKYGNFETFIIKNKKFLKLFVFVYEAAFAFCLEKGPQ